MILVHILVLVSAPQLDSEETRIRRLEQRQSESALDIEYLNTEEGVQVDLHAKRVPFSSVVKKVASDLGYTVAGLDRLQRDPYVDSRLSNRSLPSAMAWIAGSAGLHVRIWGTSIDVTEEIPINPRREDLYLLAQSALGRALADHPDSSQAPRAQWIRAEMESELPDRDWECALAFDDLVEGYPDSDLVPAAMLEAGKHYGRHGRWDLAIDRFDKLAAYRTPHPFGAETRRRLAEAHTHLAEEAQNPTAQRENAHKALLVLDALDDNAPAQDSREKRERLIIRARASSLAGDALAALRAVDLAASYSAYGDRDPDLMDLRSDALERAGQKRDAVTSWLWTAQQLTGPKRIEALRRAAACANSCNAHLTAIAAYKTAAAEGFGVALADEYNRAMMGLGLELDTTFSLGDRDRIAEAERAIASRNFERAVVLLRPVFDRRFGLDATTRQKLAITYAKALDRDKRLDEAIHVLRTAAQEAERIAERSELYDTASHIFERNDDLERAILALNGSL